MATNVLTTVQENYSTNKIIAMTADSLLSATAATWVNRVAPIPSEIKPYMALALYPGVSVIRQSLVKLGDELPTTVPIQDLIKSTYSVNKLLSLGIDTTLSVFVGNFVEDNAPIPRIVKRYGLTPILLYPAVSTLRKMAFTIGDGKL